MIRSLLLCLILASCASGPGPKDAVALLEFEGGGTCSGTFLAPRMLLTASHCFDGIKPLATINGTPVAVVSIRHDGADHALLVLDVDFPAWVRVGAPPAQGDEVYFYGNPSGLRDLLRRGVIAGQNDQFIFADIMIGHGDSGAGVFNRRGELVAVIAGYGENRAFHMGTLRPIADGFLP